MTSQFYCLIDRNEREWGNFMEIENKLRPYKYKFLIGTEVQFVLLKL
jgi:hypothetical protein